MTKEEFEKLEFRFVSHLSMQDYNILTMESVDYKPTIHVSRTVKKDTNRVQSVIYIFNREIYQSTKELLRAITKYENKQ